MRHAPVLFAALAVFASACNRPDVRARESVTASSYEVAENAFLGGLVGTVTVDAASRDVVELWELGSTTRAVYQDGSAPAGEASISVNLQNKATEGLDDGYARPEWSGAPFDDCSDPGFTELDNGGCSAEVAVFVSTDIVANFTVDLVVRGWLPEGDSTDTEGMELTVDIEAIAPEDNPS